MTRRARQHASGARLRRARVAARRARDRAARLEGVLAIIRRTGVAYVAPDVYERLRARGHVDELFGDGARARGVELVVLPLLEPGTIAGFDFDLDAMSGRLAEMLGPMPTPRDFDRWLWGSQ